MGSTIEKSASDRIDIEADSSHPYRAWYFLFFIISGFCGLVYEVIWVRLAMASFGVNTAMVSIVIAMFMAGLGLGSWIAGRAARRGMSGSVALRLYALVELLVGVSAIAVPYEFKLGRHVLLHSSVFGAWQSSGYFLLAGICVALALIPWCTCMGATFPLLMAVIRNTQGKFAEQSFSFLYIANVMGALVGTLTSAFVLVELFGFGGTLRIAGSLNAMLALLSFSLSYRIHNSKPQVPAIIARTHLYGLADKWVLVFLFLTGMATMAVEVVWIRQYTPYLGSTVYTFALILAVYLLATTLGSRDYLRWSHSHNISDSASSWGVLALSLVLPVLAVDPFIRIGSFGLPGLLRLSAIVPFCAFAGFLTPMLVDSWSGGDPDRAGTAYAVNIAGCIAGPLIAGFCLLPIMSERWAEFSLSLPLFSIALWVSWSNGSLTSPEKRRAGRIKLLAFAVVAMMVLAFSHDYESAFSDPVVLRDSTATVMAAGKGFNRHLLVNGVGMTSLDPITKYIAHLPLATMKRPPKDGLVICFGMGTSFRSMLSWGISTTAVELVPSVPKVFSYYHADAAKILRSPLAHIYVDDGRRFLDGSSKTFDVIVVDPPPPVGAPGSSLLYSREFYAVVKRHLREGGIMQMWYPEVIGDSATTAAVTKTLVQSFPYVRAFRSCDEFFGVHFLASMSPITDMSSATLAARMPPAAVADLLEWGPKKNLEEQLDLVVSHEIKLQSLIDLDPQVPVISDDAPINEYFKLRQWFHYYR